MTGHSDIAYRLLQETGCPSWLYPVTMGATTIWERWDSMLPDGSINPGDMTSFNHYALGAVADWMHRVVGGLAYDAVERVVTVAPVPGGTLTHASAALETPYGRASSAWRLEGDAATVTAVIPAGLAGHVVLPDGTEYRVASGSHQWTVPLVAAPGRPGTIRELISSPFWAPVSDEIARRTPLPDARAVATMLRRALDAPVEMIALAATLGGTLGPADELQQEISSVLERPAGRNAPSASATRG